MSDSEYEEDRRSVSRERSRNRSPSRSHSPERSPTPLRSPSGERSQSEERSPSRERGPSPHRSPVPEGHCGGPPGPPGDVGLVQFCSLHKVDLDPETCNACRNVSRMVRPEVLKQLVMSRVSSGGVEGDDVPSAASRFCRSDDPVPTLTFSPSSMELATKIFSLGRFKVPHHFEELTKKHLFLPVGQNEQLTGNLDMEDMFRAHERSGKFKHIFSYKNQVIKVTKDLRIAQVCL